MIEIIKIRLFYEIFIILYLEINQYTNGNLLQVENIYRSNFIIEIY